MAVVNGSQSHRKRGWAERQPKFEDPEHPSSSIAALWSLAGSDVTSSLASHHIAKLPWRHSAPPLIILAAVRAAYAWLCASWQQFAGVLAIFHGFTLGVVWGWPTKTANADLTGQRFFRRPHFFICLRVCTRGQNRLPRFYGDLGWPSRGIDRTQWPSRNRCPHPQSIRSRVSHNVRNHVCLEAVVVDDRMPWGRGPTEITNYSSGRRTRNLRH